VETIRRFFDPNAPKFQREVRMKKRKQIRSERANYSEITKRLDLVTDQLDAMLTRLDVMVNLLLDIISDERFGLPRDFTPKLAHLDSTRWILLRPSEAGRIFGRPAKDVSSRRREIAAAKLKKARKTKKSSGNQMNNSQSANQPKYTTHSGKEENA
jgi:hypothetical protein